jgi:serine protease Do
MDGCAGLWRYEAAESVQSSGKAMPPHGGTGAVLPGRIPVTGGVSIIREAVVTGAEAFRSATARDEGHVGRPGHPARKAQGEPNPVGALPVIAVGPYTRARCRLALWAMVVVGCAFATAQAQTPESDRARRRSPIVQVFEECRDAVVNISTTRVVRHPFDDMFNFGRPSESRSVGSGVVVHPRGFIVTNAHVVRQASDVRITFADGQTLPATIVAVDPDNDLAVMLIRTERPLRAIRLGRSDDLMVGETVIAIGNPLGLQNTVTAGIISALGRELDFGSRAAYRGLIQTDAAINPGNSGGPLLNINGELVGINTAIRGDAQNVGFAIAVDKLWEILPHLLDIERRERVRFGLDVSGSNSEIVAVRPNSPAAAGGLRPGDRVVRFNGEDLRDGIDYYVHLLSQKPGDVVRLTVSRGDQLVTREIRLQEIPPPDGAKLARELLGVELVEFPESVRRRYDLPPNLGPLVERVAPKGPAAQAGIQPGDVLLRIDRITVGTLGQVGLALESLSPGAAVVADILRVRDDELTAGAVKIQTARPRR